MNKIYKVIWSKTRNCYVAVSEIAKRNGKSCSSVNCGRKANRTSSLHMTAVTLGVTAALIGGVGFGSPIAWAASSGNTVTVIEDAPHHVYGGCANSEKPYYDCVIGGYSSTETDPANSNTVIIGEGISVNNRVFGGSSAGGDTNFNNVTVNSGAKIGEQLFGGTSGKGNANQSTVTINGGQCDAEVYGGRSAYGNADQNTVTIDGGQCSEVYGGEASDTGNATGNQVEIKNGATVNNNVYGGYTYGGTAG